MYERFFVELISKLIGHYIKSYMGDSFKIAVKETLVSYMILVSIDKGFIARLQEPKNKMPLIKGNPS